MSDSSIPQAIGTGEGENILEEMDTQEAQNPSVSPTDQLDDQGQDEAESQPMDFSGTMESAAICSPDSSEPPQPDSSSLGRSDLNEVVSRVRGMGGVSSPKTPTEDRATLSPEEIMASQQTSLVVASTAGESKTAFRSDLLAGVAQAMQSETPTAEEAAETTAAVPMQEPQPKKSSPLRNIAASSKDLFSNPDKESGFATSSIETTSRPTPLEASGSKSSSEKAKEFTKRKAVSVDYSTSTFSLSFSSGDESTRASSSGIQGDVSDTAQSSLSSPEHNLVDIHALRKTSRMPHRNHFETSDPSTPEPSSETSSSLQDLHQQGPMSEPLPQQEQREGLLELSSQERQIQPLDMLQNQAQEEHRLEVVGLGEAPYEDQPKPISQISGTDPSTSQPRESEKSHLEKLASEKYKEATARTAKREQNLSPKKTSPFRRQKKDDKTLPKDPREDPKKEEKKEPKPRD